MAKSRKTNKSKTNNRRSYVTLKGNKAVVNFWVLQGHVTITCDKRIGRVKGGCLYGIDNRKSLLDIFGIKTIRRIIKRAHKCEGLHCSSSKVIRPLKCERTPSQVIAQASKEDLAYVVREMAVA